MEEKRSHVRYKINQLVACTPEGEEFLRAEGIDLSRGGMRCRSAQAVEPMTNVFLILKVPSAEGEREVACEGYVSHSRMVEGQCVFGLRFISIAEEGKGDFYAFLESLETGA